MAAELLGCPFCGGSNIFLRDGYGIEDRVECDDCQAAAYGDDAIAAWNRRAALPSAAGEVVEKLRPNWKHDEAASYAVSALRAFGHAGLAEDLSREIAENNARKSEAADLIVSLERERDEARATNRSLHRRTQADEGRAFRKAFRLAEAGLESIIVKWLYEKIDAVKRAEAAEAALSEIIALDDEFRASMMPNAEVDPLTEACDRARALLTPAEEGR